MFVKADAGAVFDIMGVIESADGDGVRAEARAGLIKQEPAGAVWETDIGDENFAGSFGEEFEGRFDIAGTTDGVVVGGEVIAESILEFGIVFYKEDVEAPSWWAFKMHNRKRSKGQARGKGKEEFSRRRRTMGEAKVERFTRALQIWVKLW